MATIRIITKSDKKGQPVSLYLRFKEGRTIDITVITPIKVFSEYWNNNKGEFKQRIVFDEIFSEDSKVKMESELSKLKIFVLEQYNELAKTNAVVTKEWLSSVIDKYYNKETSKELTLNTYIDNFIKDIVTGNRLYNHNGITKRYEKGSIKNIKGFQVQFNAYQLSKRIKLNFNTITIDFYDEYVKYFTKKGYSVNTIGRHIKTLKSIMRCAREEGLHNNTEIDRKKFKVLKTSVENIYLTETEINNIYHLDLNDKPQLDIARDIFLIGCYTAQRFSDYSKIRPAHIKTIENGLKVIDLIQQKTGERVIIPIKPELDEILKKYNYQVPKTFEQKINERIKEIGQMAGITETVIIEENKGGLKVKKDVKKNELIKTHTARRTGCTLMYLAGVPSIDIMKISGHKSEREFLNYIKVGKEETAQNLSKHPYFMGSHLKIAK
jgi:integrase